MSTMHEKCCATSTGTLLQSIVSQHNHAHHEKERKFRLFKTFKTKI